MLYLIIKFSMINKKMNLTLELVFIDVYPFSNYQNQEKSMLLYQ